MYKTLLYIFIHFYIFQLIYIFFYIILQRNIYLYIEIYKSVLYIDIIFICHNVLKIASIINFKDKILCQLLNEINLSLTNRKKLSFINKILNKRRNKFILHQIRLVGLR